MYRAKTIYDLLATLSLLLLCSQTQSLYAQQDAKGTAKPLPVDIVKAWTNAGAQVGWMYVNKNDVLEFDTDVAVPVAAVPAFRFAAWTENTLVRLPDPGMPFGLDLCFTKVTDAGLKALAGLKSLTFLNLFRTKVTDMGIARLKKDLPRCSIFQ